MNSSACLVVLLLSVAVILIVNIHGSSSKIICPHLKCPKCQYGSYEGFNSCCRSCYRGPGESCGGPLIMGQPTWICAPGLNCHYNGTEWNICVEDISSPDPTNTFGTITVGEEEDDNSTVTTIGQE